MFSALKNVFYQKNVHLCASAFKYFSMKNIYLSASWPKWCFLNFKVLSSRRIYSSVYVLMKNIYLCSSVLKCCFLHLKIFLPEEHTPLWKCLIEEFSPLCELTEMVFSTLEKVFYSNNLHLSVSVFHIFQWRIHTLKTVFFTPENVFYLKNIHLCASWLKWCLLYLQLFSNLRIYTSVRVFFNFF